MPDLYKTLLHNAVAESKSPGAVLYVGDLQTTHAHIAEGYRQLIPKKKSARRDTLYDLASLTKVVGTITAIMQLRDRGLINLDQPITDFVPLPPFHKMTLRHLMTHTSGLVAVERYFESMTSQEEMFQNYAVGGIESDVDWEHRYSDVGYMLLGKVVEQVSRESLEVYFEKNIFAPLGMKRTSFNPPEEWRKNCAATENDPWRGKIMLGEVHDENTWAVGGISGHAGLFSTADDLAIFCRALLSGKLLNRKTVAEMVTMGIKPFYPWQGLGWQIDPWSSKKTGFLPSRTTFGHTGWTGTSIWLDSDTGPFVILLSNTCHPNRRSRDNETLRRVVHTEVGNMFYTETNAHTGLDRLVRENFKAIENKRIALLTNHAAVDQRGKHILEVLDYAPELQLVRLYSPEHGIRGQAEAGEKVHSQTATVPVISLYGAQKAPSRDELKKIDLFVVDLQDIGARYYTYMATMRRCMRACAEADVPVLILDRPNPLGGEVLEGPIAVNTDSLVCCSPIPIRHGMTMGELATWFARTDLRESRLTLSVKLLDNWQPRRLFSECQLPWIAPSPNIPTPEAALWYVGICLFEGTNLNEGRGTDTPFEVVGAPWLNGEAVIKDIPEKDIPGVRLEAITYTPVSIPGKSTSPRFMDEACEGIRLHLESPKDARPFRTAVALLAAIQKNHPDELAWDGSPPVDLLAGGPDLRLRIQRGESASAIVQAYADAVEDFDKHRPRLYDEDGITTN